jgi:hypothetical protein
MIVRIADLVARAAARRPWLVLAIASALTIVSALLATRIQVKTAFQDTMADDDPIVRRMTYLGENFPGAVVVQVVLEGNSPDRLIAAGEALRDGFVADTDKDDRLVSHVYLEQDLDFFLRRALLYLPAQELRILDENLRRHRDSLRTLSADPSLLGLLRGLEALTDDAVPTQSTALTVKTRLFADVVMSSLLAGRPAVDVGARVDPGPVRERLDARLREGLKGLPLPPSDTEARRTLQAVEGALDLVADVLEQGAALDAAAFNARAAALLELAPEQSSSSSIPPRYQFSADKRLLLMEVGSERNLGKLEDIRPVLDHLYGVADSVRGQFPDVAIGFTGLPVQYVQEQEAILSNFVLVTILGFLGILAVFVVGFEQVALPSLSAVPLIMGILWTFGVQAVVDPTLNMLNLLFPVVLFGLGVDAAIHLLNGFAHRRALGDDAESAVRHMLEELLPGLLTGSATTAMAFFTLMIAHMKGLKTLGFTAGVGVVMAVVAMVTVLPAIFVLADRRSPVVGMAGVHGDGDGVLHRLGAFVGRQRYPVLAVFIAVVSIGVYFAPTVSLERDALKMQPRGMPAAVLQEKLLKAFAISGEPSIFFAKDLVEAEQIVARAKRARTVSPPLAITLALPEGQAEKGPILDNIARSLKAGVAVGDAAPHAYTPAELEELRLRLAGLKALLLEVSAVAPVLYRDDTVDLVGKLRDDVNRIERRLADANVDRLQLLDRHLRGAVTDSVALVTDMTQHKTVGFDDLPASLRARVGGRDGATMVLVRANGYVGDEQFLEAHVAELYAIHPRSPASCRPGARCSGRSSPTCRACCR